jgi:hypothetical protein
VDLDLLALEDDLAAVRLVRPGDRLDERGLAGAVVADERNDLRGVDLEVDVGERLDRAEALRDLLQLKGGPAVSGRRRGGGGAAASFRLRSVLGQLVLLPVMPPPFWVASTKPEFALARSKA